MTSPRFAATIALLVAYLGAAGLSMRVAMPWRVRLLAALNVGTLAALCFLDQSLNPPLFVLYVALVVAHWAVTSRVTRAANVWPWLAALLPIGYLIAIRSAPYLAPTAQVAGVELQHIGPYFIGLSFMAFRLSHLALEVRNEVVAPPGFATYMAYAFFLPTIAVGPISPYSLFARSLERPDRTATPVGRSLLRIVVGLAKYLFLAQLADRLTYRGLLLDGHPHGLIDLVVAMFAYYLYLYCNFSGFCDLAIGGAGLLGLRVAENFNHPLIASSVREYWNRWHMTLSLYMRDMVFTPLSKMGVRRVGPRHAPHAIAFALTVVFLLIGVWHGLGWGYLIHGALHAVAMVCNHYYTLALKRYLTKDHLRAYMKSRIVMVVTVALTQFYVAATMFFFANDVQSMRQIVAALTEGSG